PDSQATRFPCAPHQTGPSSHRPHSSAHPESAPPPDKRPPASPETHFLSRHAWSGESKPPSRVVFQCDARIDPIIAQSGPRLKTKSCCFDSAVPHRNRYNGSVVTFPFATDHPDGLPPATAMGSPTACRYS